MWNFMSHCAFIYETSTWAIQTLSVSWVKYIIKEIWNGLGLSETAERNTVE